MKCKKNNRVTFGREKMRPVVLGCLFFVLCFSTFLTACGKGSSYELSPVPVNDEADMQQEDSAKQQKEGADNQSENSTSQNQTGEKDVEPGKSDGPKKKENTIFVHVCGAVKNPGVYELSEGIRCYEAVEKAGGYTPSACKDYLNMAKLLSDGERLCVPTNEEVKAAAEAGTVIGSDGTLSTGETTEGGLVNINTADEAQLCTLPGVGASRAKSIIAFRESHGGFANKEEIMQVTGIKEGLYSKIGAYITT